MQKLPCLIFLDEIVETFSWTKITYFLLRYCRNVGGRDQITMTNDHKLAFLVRNTNRFLECIVFLLIHTYNKPSILLTLCVTMLKINLPLLTGIYNQDTCINHQLIIIFLYFPELFYSTIFFTDSLSAHFNYPLINKSAA